MPGQNPGQGQGQGQPNAQQMMQMVQQKMGNLELTMNALLGVLVDKDIVDQDEVNEKAQEIIQDLQEQQEEMQGQGGPGGLEDALDEE